MQTDALYKRFLENNILERNQSYVSLPNFMVTLFRMMFSDQNRQNGKGRLRYKLVKNPYFIVFYRSLPY